MPRFAGLAVAASGPAGRGPGRRRPTLEVGLAGEGLAQQRRTDDRAVLLHERAVRLVVEGDLADREHGQGIAQTEDDGQHDQHPEGGKELPTHHLTPSALMTMSMALIPMNGAIRPPRP